MNDGFVRVACATVDTKVADISYNTEQIIKTAREACKNGVKLIVFPELCITSYTCGDLFLQRSLLDGALSALLEIKEKTADLDSVIVVGLPLSVGSELYNCAAVLNKGEIKGFVPKSNIPNHGEFYEARYFSEGFSEIRYVKAGTESVPMSTKLLFGSDAMPEFILGVEICEDLWMSQPPSGAMANAGATVIANLSASNELTGKGEYRDILIKSQSARLYCAYLYANAGNGESTTDLVFAGGSVIAENGAVLAEGKRFYNECVYSEVDLEKLIHERRKTTTFKNRGEYTVINVEFKKETTTLTRPVEQKPFVPSEASKRQKRCEEILTIQAMGLKKRMEHTCSKNAVIGISGGLDSTLALLVTVRAFDILGLDRKNIEAVTMPCFGTTDRTYNNAINFAKSLGVSFKEVNIKEAVNIHFKDIAHNPDCYDVTFENAQARERTQVLMDIANQNGGMVIGTGDLSELALGWATYNGDHMSMYGVNGGVPKTLIRYLVEYEAQRTQNEVLKVTLTDILNTPVSPELLPPKDGEIAQKTEHIVGPYELHDFFLFHFIRYSSRPRKILRLAEIAFDGVYDREFILGWLKVFYRRFFSQQFKRSCLPDGPKVGTVALSPRGDWRMPSDASVKLWKDELEML